MAGTNTESPENQEELAPVDPWEAAFAAVNAEAESNTETAATTGGVDDLPDVSNSGADTANADTYQANQDVSIDTEGESGGSDSFGGGDALPDGNAGASVEQFTAEDAKEYRESVRKELEQQAIDVVVQEYIKQGIRHTDGKLGANINQPDICKRDSDGMPRFYNPETGKEFRGDNPRRQAQEWVNDYNQALAEAFNSSTQQYLDKLMADREPEIAVLEFAPTYESLDPIRQSMFDSLVEDYEIVKDGEVIGYSCDLNKALSAVNRQVRMIQEQQKARQTQSQAAHQEQQEQAKGPALDIKSSAQAGKDKNKKPEFKSIAEAMEWQQDQLLAKQKGK